MHVQTRDQVQLALDMSKAIGRSPAALVPTPG